MNLNNNFTQPNSIEDPKLPVIIYIHGGGWFAGKLLELNLVLNNNKKYVFLGSPGPLFHGPEYFMETKKVILVVMAYRLGVMGFLSTGDDAISGNFALKDQALAIEWTYKNIENFGGDPNMITCIGQSAGAGSCHMHLFNSKVAKRLSRVVLMSGSAIAPWAYAEQNPKMKALKFAKGAGILNAETLSSQELATELRKIDAEQIVEAHEKMKVSLSKSFTGTNPTYNILQFKEWDVDRLVVFQPVVENCSKGAFLCSDHLESWANGNYKKVPILIGNSEIEGFFLL